MKKCIFFFATLFFAVTVSAQQVQWAKKYPKLGESTNPEFLEASPVSGLAVAGEYATGLTNQGLFLYKLDALGNVVWGDTMTTPNPGYDPAGPRRIYPSGMDFNAGGKLFLAGNFNDTLNIDGSIYSNIGSKNAVLIRYNTSGGKDWTRVYSNANIDDIYVDAADNLFVMISFTGTLVFYGQTFTALGTNDLIVAKISPADNLVFSKQLHGKVEGVKVKAAPSGNIYILGSFSDTLYYDTHAQEWSHAFSDFFILKTDAAGNQLYYNLISANQQEYSTDMDINYAERLVISATHCWTSGCYANLRTYDAAGNLVDQNGISGTTCSYGCSFDMKSVAVADTAGFWGIGHESNTLNYGIPEDNWTNIGLRKFDFMGNALMYDTILVSWAGSFEHKDIAADNAQNIYITITFKDTVNIGSYTLINTGPDPEFIVAKFNQFPISTNVSATDVKKNFEVYPNPASGIFNIRYNCDKNSCIHLNVKNVLGETIFSDEKEDSSPNYIRQIDLSNQAKGIYFLELNNGNEREVKKVVLN